MRNAVCCALLACALAVPTPAFAASNAPAQTSGPALASTLRAVDAQPTAEEKIATPAIVRYVVKENADTSWHHVADWPMGVDVPFNLASTFPEELAAYDTLPYWLVARLADGLTYVDGSAAVTLNHADGSNQDVTSLLTVRYASGTLTAGSTDIRQAIPTLAASDTLSLSYAARLNERANTGFALGNDSWAHLEYLEKEASETSQQAVASASAADQFMAASARPAALCALHLATTGTQAEASAQPETEPGTAGDTALTRSVQIKATVHTYRLEVSKVDESDGTPLQGASFALRDEDGLWYVSSEGDSSQDDWSQDSRDATVRTTDKNGHAAFEQVDSESYELVELQAPEGYETVPNVDVTILESSTAEGDDLRLTACSSAGRVGAVDSDTGTVRLEVADPQENATVAGDAPASPWRQLGTLLARTGDASRALLPAVLLMASVLMLLCGWAIRRGAGSWNIQGQPNSDSDAGTTERKHHVKNNR